MPQPTRLPMSLRYTAESPQREPLATGPGTHAGACIGAGACAVAIKEARRRGPANLKASTHMVSTPSVATAPKMPGRL